MALLEGRYGKARQFADEALAIPQSSGLSALIGARASIDTREFDAAEAYLGRADAGVGSLACRASCSRRKRRWSADSRARR